MGSSLLTSLLNSAGALSTYDRVFSVIQNNIANANTPGYAAQDQVLISLPFQPNGGPQGGVIPGGLLSSRNTFLEQAVRQGQSQLGTAQQTATDLTQIQSQFSLTSTSGLSDSFNSFFGAASQLSNSPNDPVLRQQIITQAGNVAQQFNLVASGIQQTSANIDQSTQNTVSTINNLADQIGQINVQAQTNGPNHDAGLEAQLYSSLETLSSSANVSVIQASDGTFNLYLGQTPLVVGSSVSHISAGFASQQTVIYDSLGNDITSQVTGGALAGQIQGQELDPSGLHGQLKYPGTDVRRPGKSNPLSGNRSERPDAHGQPIHLLAIQSRRVAGGDQHHARPDRRRKRWSARRRRKRAGIEPAFHRPNRRQQHLHAGVRKHWSSSRVRLECRPE